MDISTNEEILWLELSRALTELDRRVDYLCIACNVLHYFTDRIQGLSLHARFISIANITEQVIVDGEDFALLSISKVIEGGQLSPYRNTLTKFSLEIPSPIEMDTLVTHIKKHGGNDKASVEMFRNVLSGLIAKNVVLACTDLPLIPLEMFPDRTFYDVSDLLARKLAEFSYTDKSDAALA
jgi:aspartate racemase